MAAEMKFKRNAIAAILLAGIILPAESNDPYVRWHEEIARASILSVLRGETPHGGEQVHGVSIQSEVYVVQCFNNIFSPEEKRCVCVEQACAETPNEETQDDECFTDSCVGCTDDCLEPMVEPVDEDKCPPPMDDVDCEGGPTQ
jgi:hypothetical protein